ncbi:YesL family protein [Gracilibacillus sp. YIM 98692]|uniref:YesL family protein n=1 Tax=Gracilibacillus sp. YIM 98692 TaxID=2663532 RepID=UPI0013D3B856|nr:YesL family protein [Gracilibacillus sp. YIM 98692]
MNHEGILYKTAVWITRLAYLNFLWMAFSAIGLILFGFFPALVAMFAIERKWIRGNKDLPIFRTFWIEYKSNFKNANLIGYTFLMFGLLIYINMMLAYSIHSWIGNILLFFVFGLAFLISIIFIYIFPIYVHYDVRIIESIIFTFVIALSSPLKTILIIVNILAYFFIALYIPGIILVFTGSALSFITMWFSYQALQQVENKKPLHSYN